MVKSVMIILLLDRIEMKCTWIRKWKGKGADETLRSAQELVEMNITPDISNDIDIDICKASEYNQHSIFLKFNRYHN